LNPTQPATPHTPDGGGQASEQLTLVLLRDTPEFKSMESLVQQHSASSSVGSYQQTREELLCLCASLYSLRHGTPSKPEQMQQAQPAWSPEFALPALTSRSRLYLLLLPSMLSLGLACFLSWLAGDSGATTILGYVSLLAFALVSLCGTCKYVTSYLGRH
jgi:hypothetical protein